MTATPTTLTFDRRDAIATITLDRPVHANGMNGMNGVMARELAAVAAECDGEAGIRAVVLTARTVLLRRRRRQGDGRAGRAHRGRRQAARR